MSRTHHVHIARNDLAKRRSNKAAGKSASLRESRYGLKSAKQRRVNERVQVRREFL